MATYTHPVTGEVKEYIPYAELSDEQKKHVDSDTWTVRELAAEDHYGLDKLVDDPDWSVRAAVAEQGYGLDKLVDDPVEYVRMEVAKQGYGLDKLINDPGDRVREEALLALKRFVSVDRLLDTWMQDNRDRCVLPEKKQ